MYRRYFLNTAISLESPIPFFLQQTEKFALAMIGRRKVLIVDDDPDIHQGLEFMLRGSFLLVHAFSIEEAIEQLQATPLPVILLDLVLNKTSGIELLKWLAGMSFAPRTIVLTGNGSEEAAISAFHLGAFKYIRKPPPAAMLKRFIEEAFTSHENEFAGSRACKEQKLATMGLRSREIEVALGIYTGETNAEIAARLAIAQRTVEKHLERIYTKTGVNSRTKLIHRINSAPIA